MVAPRRSGGASAAARGQPYTIGQDSVVVLGPPFVFNADNIDKYVTEFGF